MRVTRGNILMYILLLLLKLMIIMKISGRLLYSRDFVLYHTDVDESYSSDFANRLGEGINNTSVVIELLADFNINYPNGILN